MNNSRLFITNSVGLEENDLGNGLRREGKGFLGVAFATKESSWNPLKYSYLWSVQPFLCDVFDEFGRHDGGGGDVYHQRGMSEGLCGTFRLKPV